MYTSTREKTEKEETASGLAGSLVGEEPCAMWRFGRQWFAEGAAVGRSDWMDLRESI